MTQIEARRTELTANVVHFSNKTGNLRLTDDMIRMTGECRIGL